MRTEYKKNRELTVHYLNPSVTGNYYYGRRDPAQRPLISLSGLWLENLGFNIGDKINVECEDGKLVITKKETTE